MGRSHACFAHHDYGYLLLTAILRTHRYLPLLAATYRYLPLLTATYRYPELTAQRIAHLRRRASCAYTCYDYSVLTTTAYLPTIASSTRCFIEARVLASALQSRTFRCSR